MRKKMRKKKTMKPSLDTKPAAATPDPDPLMPVGGTGLSEATVACEKHTKSSGPAVLGLLPVKTIRQMLRIKPDILINPRHVRRASRDGDQTKIYFGEEVMQLKDPDGAIFEQLAAL